MSIHKRKPSRTAAESGFSRGVLITGMTDGYDLDDDFDADHRPLDDASIDHIAERWNGGKHSLAGAE